VRALAEIEAAEATLDSGRRAPTGRLRVSVPVLFGRHCAAPVLLELARKHPQLQLDITFTDRVVDLVEENVDLAVRIAPLATRASLIARRLGTFGALVCASPDYLAARGTPEAIADLDAHDTIIYARQSPVASWFFLDANGEREQAQIRSRLRLDDLEAIADAAVAGAGAGAGVTWLPCWLATAHLRDGRLVELPLGKRRFGFDVYAVWPQTRHLPSRVRVAVDDLAARIPEVIATAELPVSAL